jgi:hypothetical protein
MKQWNPTLFYGQYIPGLRFIYFWSTNSTIGLSQKRAWIGQGATKQFPFSGVNDDEEEGGRRLFAPREIQPDNLILQEGLGRGRSSGHIGQGLAIGRKWRRGRNWGKCLLSFFSAIIWGAAVLSPYCLLTFRQNGQGEKDELWPQKVGRWNVRKFWFFWWVYAEIWGGMSFERVNIRGKLEVEEVFHQGPRLVAKGWVDYEKDWKWKVFEILFQIFENSWCLFPGQNFLHFSSIFQTDIYVVKI